jgi:hypothetical protein
MSLLNVAANLGASVAAAAQKAMNGQAGGGPLKSGAVNKALTNMNKRGYGAKISKAMRPTK